MYINNYPPYRYIVFTQCLHIKTSIDHSFLIRSRSGLLRTEVCRSVSQNHGTLSWSWRYWSFSSFYSIHFLVFDSFPVKVVVEHSDHISSDTQGETLGGVLWILSERTTSDSPRILCFPIIPYTRFSHLMMKTNCFRAR